MFHRNAFVARWGLGLAFGAVVALAAIVALGSALQAQDQMIYKDPKQPEEVRLDDLMKRLTTADKIDLMGGTGFATKEIHHPGVDIPPMKMTDGPLGVRWNQSTVLPGGPLTAATFDPVAMQEDGQVIGEEVVAQPGGEVIILGPGLNIHRTPFNGRNGEYFSEDPYLAGVAAANYVKGVQAAGAAATCKHYDCNNEEHDRDYINVHVSDRALREIYLPAFRAAVQQGGTLDIMDSYNLVNGFHASENDYLLNEILKKEWGFQGMVMSDWGGVHSALGSVMNGNDLEMPTGNNVNQGSINPLIANGKIPMFVIDDHVRRILRVELRLGLLDGTNKRLPESTIADQAHLDMVKKVAEEGIILLKNDAVGETPKSDNMPAVPGNPVLPIDRTKVKSIAVIGQEADHMPGTIGGSAWVTPKVPMTSPLMGINAIAGDGVTVQYASGASQGGGGGADTSLPLVPSNVLTPPAGTTGKGLLGEYFTGTTFEGTPVMSQVDAKIDFNWSITPPGKMPHDNYSVRWTGQLTAPTAGSYTFSLRSDDGSRLTLDGKVVIDNWGAHGVITKTGTVTLTQGQVCKVLLEFFQGGGDSICTFGWQPPAGGAPVTTTTGFKPTGDAGIDAAAMLAAKSDVAIVCVGTTSDDEGEGHDRNSLALPRNQDALVAAVVAANPRTVVVLFSGGVLVPGSWVNDVPAVLYAYYPGHEGGAALAEILFGDVNPSGRLPDTIGKKREDFSDYPYYGTTDVYTEGIYVGYRHFDKANIEPLFCFGHGLSYTTFKYSNLQFMPVLTGPAAGTHPASPDTLQADGKMTVSVDVENTGTRAGDEVVQLYVHDPQPHVDKAPKELKGFTRVSLKPGEKKTATLTIDGRSLAYVDEVGKQWKADAGEYEIQVGASSRDIRQTGTIKLAHDWTEAVPGMHSDPAPTP